MLRKWRQTGATMLSIAAAAVCFAQSKSPITVEAKPVFDGLYSLERNYPVDYVLSNTGPNASVTLLADDQEARQTFQVDLPNGTTKRVRIIHPRGTSLVSISTPYGQMDGELKRVPAGDLHWPVLYIGDDGTALRSFALQDQLKSPPPRKALDFYGLPGNLPTRAWEFGQLKLVVLGAGAERMNNDEVAALRGYVAAGGILAFSGGPTESCLRDPRWSQLIPLSGLRTGTQAGEAVWPTLSGLYSVTTGDLKPGATVTQNKVPVHRFGLGKVAVLPFDLGDRDIRRWAGLSEFFRKALIARLDFESVERQSSVPTSLQTIAIHSSPGSSRYGYSYYSSPSNGLENSPFDLKLPDFGKIFWLLTGYILLVVPVSYLVLKRLKKGELAWFTAPFIAACFTAVLFSMSRGIQAFTAETTAQGTVTVDPISGTGSYIGEISAFYPRAGVKPSPIQNPDFIRKRDSSEFDYSSYGESPPSFEQSGGAGEWMVQSSSASFVTVSAMKTVEFKDQIQSETSQLPNGGLRITVRVKDLEIESVALQAYGVEKPLSFAFNKKPGGNFALNLSKSQVEEVRNDAPESGPIVTLLLKGDLSAVLLGRRATQPGTTSIFYPISAEAIQP